MSSPARASHDDWDAHWHHYAHAAGQNPAQGMRHNLIAKLLRDTGNPAALRVFDVGSGQGDLLRKLEQVLPGARLLGAELSESGVAVSRQKVPQATFLVANIFEPPPALDEYVGWATHAVCSEVLEHVDEPVAFLQRAGNYLAPGAQLIVTVPGGPMSEFDRNIGHRQHFDRRKIKAMLEQAGYSVERIYLAGFPFFNLYRLLVIARGKRLAGDVRTESGGFSSKMASYAMKLFRLLFRANMLNSPLGWQIIAVARRAS